MAVGFCSTFQVNGTPDIGGVSMSRYHVMAAGGAMLLPADQNAAAAAVAAIYTALKANFPGPISFQVQPTTTTFDVVSGTVTGSFPIGTVPGAVVGTGSGNYAGGSGARGYWHTASVVKRRIVRGATYYTPFVLGGYSTNGALSAVVAGQVQTAMQNYLAAINTAGLQAVVYCRPPKGATAGGFAAPITAASCSVTPGSLRSRRT